MIRSATISVVFHLAVAGALALDLPSFDDREPVNAETIVTVSYETVGPETNLKTAGEPEEPAPDVPISAPDQQRQPPPETAPPPPPPPVEAETAEVAPAPEPVPAPQPEPEAEAPPPPAPRPVVELDPDGTLAPRKQVEEKVEKLAKLEPLPVPEPKPVEKASPKPLPEVPKPRPQQVAKATTPVPEARPKKTPEKQEALFDRLSAKLDRLNKDKPTPPVEKNETRISDIRIGEGGTARNRIEAVLTVSERDLLRSHIARNWFPNHGAPGIQEMRADVHLFLNKDGTLARPPELIDVHDAGQSDRVVQAFTSSAVRAVQKAQPLPMPPEKFEQWREMVFTFSLKEVYGQ